ncbi:MAG: glycosyltransferase [Lentisphaerae bacterium]|nr:glycosyltransferase [Lentisphaerota bacterium]
MSTSSAPIAGNGFRFACFIDALRGGGAEENAVKRVQGLTARGMRIELVVARAHGPNRARAGTLRVVDLGSRSVPVVVWRLIAYLRRERPDVLAASNMIAILAAIFAVKCFSRRTRLIAEQNTVLSRQLEHERRHSDRLAIRLASRLVPLLYPLADIWVAVSRGVAEDLVRSLRLDAARVRTIYSPGITPDLQKLRHETPAHAWFREPVPVIVSAGRLSRVKDYPTLLHAFQWVRRKRPVRLIILGEGPERKRLETLIDRLELRDAVDLHGYVDNPFSFMNRAAVYVQASRHEGMGNALVQALACGCRVVSTDSPGGAREVLRAGRYGEFVAVGDAAGMAEAINRALDGPAAPADPDWLRQFTPEHALDQWQRLLCEAAAGRPSGKGT